MKALVVPRPRFPLRARRSVLPAATVPLARRAILEGVLVAAAPARSELVQAGDVAGPHGVFDLRRQRAVVPHASLRLPREFTRHSTMVLHEACHHMLPLAALPHKPFLPRLAAPAERQYRA